jgi:MFS family permease
MKPLSVIYWFNSLSALGWSLIGIFIPIYLLTLGYPLGTIVLFYLLDSCTVFLFSIVAGFLSSRIGLKKTLLIYLPFLFLFVVGLYLVGRFAIPLWLIALVSGIQTAFYFMPMNIMFAQLASEEKMGASVGKMSAYSQAASLAAPLIGGGVAVAGGFTSLVILSGFIFLLAAFCLLLIPDAHPKIQLSAGKIVNLARKYTRYSFAQVFQFFQQILESVAWPIFIFLTFKNIFSVGFVGALFGAGNFFFMLFVGNRSDSHKKRNIFKIGAVTMGAIWMLRFFGHGQSAYYILTIMAGFVGVLILIPFNAQAFNMSKRSDNITEFLIFREFLLLVGRFMAFGLIFILANRLEYTFIAAAVSNLAFFLL